MPHITRRGISLAALAAMTPLASCATAADSGAAPGTTAAVETATGRVRGRRDNGVSTFLGIPYGTDTSTHRFQPARAPAAWRGVRDCFALGHQAPQMESTQGRNNPAMNTPFVLELLAATKQGMEEGNEGEDCLVLNVYTPDASRARKRPVMFWMHGGGYAMGSAGDPQYNGAPLARRGDVVVVTVNHRLNALGYLYLGALHDDFADSGNVGQHDLVLALQWVRDNIEAFGGDPANVTIFGESGGGSKVSMTLGAQSAQGLFHKAIIQSGPGLRAGSRDAAATFAERTLAALNIAPADVHRLQTLPHAQVLQAAMQAQSGGGMMGGGLSPIVDGRYLTRHPFDPDANPLARGIPLMIGTCKDETTLFSAIDPLFPNGTEAQVQERFRQQVGERGDAAFNLYKSMAPNDAPAYWMTSMSTQRGTWMNSIRLAERQAVQNPGVYMFRHDWHVPLLGGVLRTPHGVSVPFAFDTVHARDLEFGTGPEPRAIAAKVSQAWANFARSGDPSQEGLAWPRYNAQTRQTMLFNTESRVVADPDRPAREFWTAGA